MMADEFEPDSLPPAVEMPGQCEIRVGSSEAGDAVVALFQDGKPAFTAFMSVDELREFVRDALRVIGRLDERAADPIGSPVGRA